MGKPTLFDTPALGDVTAALENGRYAYASALLAPRLAADPDNDALLGLMGQALVFTDQFDAAVAHMTAAHANALRRAAPPAEIEHHRAWRAFAEGQRDAFALHDAYQDYFRDSRRGHRWGTNRPQPFEYFVRNGALEGRLPALRETGRRLQETALNLFAIDAYVQQLRDTVTAVSDAATNQDPPLLFLSDSHSRYFEWLIHLGRLPQAVAGVCSVSQANIYGLWMPSREVRTRPHFLDALARFPSHTAVVLHLGEVDCRAIYWNLSQHLGDFQGTFLDQVIANLDRMMTEIARTHPRIIVTAPIVPTYELRPPTNEPLGAEIRDLTLRLCDRMADLCRKRSAGFATINDSVRFFNGTLKNDYFRTIWGNDKKTHHFYAPKVADFWAEALTTALAKL